MDASGGSCRQRGSQSLLGAIQGPTLTPKWKKPPTVGPFSAVRGFRLCGSSNRTNRPRVRHHDPRSSLSSGLDLRLPEGSP